MCKLSLSLLVVVFTTAIFTNVHGGIIKNDVFRACEHRGIRTLQCPENSVIQVVNAFYGRKSDEVCYPNTKETDCSAEGSQEIIEKLCNGKSSCQINPANSVFGDPCHGTIKYVEVSYKCIPGNVFHACEHHGARTLECPENSVIIVANAFYGRQSDKLCYPNTKETDCSAEGSQQMIEKLCNGKPSCQINPANSVFGDPCHGTTKYVEVSYECMPVDIFHACEHHGTRTLQCPEKSVIVIANAFYGRQSDKVCYPNNKETDCSADGSQEIIEKLCNGKPSCQINPANNVFGDPCYGTTKYVEVSYECMPVDVFHACEHHGARTLQCPKNSVILVANAFYGRQSDKVCYPNTKETNCSAQGSQEIIEKLCNGKPSCQINPANNVFSDPCHGTTKYVEVSYKCMPGEVYEKMMN